MLVIGFTPIATFSIVPGALQRAKIPVTDDSGNVDGLIFMLDGDFTAENLQRKIIHAVLIAFSQNIITMFHLLT